MLFREAVGVLRTATAPMTAREIADALIVGKAPQATRKQAIDLQAAILAALRKRNGGAVTGEGAPARWRLKVAAKAAVYVGVALRSWETAVTSCAGANGLVKRMLLGTPCEAH
jgi:hypothetical protein